MSDDFDDDEDIDLDDDLDGDEELAASSSDVAPVDEDDDAPANIAKPFDPDAPVPFFKNWIWWVSLIAAIPALALLVSMVLSAINYAAEWNWMMWIVAVCTFFCASAAVVMPLLLALGFMLGGKEAKAPAVPAKAGADESSESVGNFDDDDGFEDDEFDDDAFDEDDEEDDFDF